MASQRFSMDSDDIETGKAFIAEAHKKLTRIAQEFASGEINRAQFQHLYDRYQRQIMTVAQLIAESDPSTWYDAVGEDNAETTLLIKQTLAAKIMGFSVYENESSMPIETAGDFMVDAELIVPMLSSYRSATAEIFQANISSSQLENGHWIYFFAGRFTTLIALFSLEPATNQIPMVKQMHNDYETANENILLTGKIKQVALPFLAMIKRSTLVSDKLKQLPED